MPALSESAGNLGDLKSGPVAKGVVRRAERGGCDPSKLPICGGDE